VFFLRTCVSGKVGPNRKFVSESSFACDASCDIGSFLGRHSAEKSTILLPNISTGSKRLLRCPVKPPNWDEERPFFRGDVMAYLATLNNLSYPSLYQFLRMEVRGSVFPLEQVYRAGMLRALSQPNNFRSLIHRTKSTT